MRQGIFFLCWLWAGQVGALELRVTDQPLSDVVAALVSETGWSVAVPPGFQKAPTTLSIDTGTPEAALRAIAEFHGLTVGGGPVAWRLQTVVAEQELKVFELRHREATEILNLLTDAGWGNQASLALVADPDTNRIVVTGDVAQVKAVAALVQVLDVEVSQILIEAKLVSMDTQVRQALGVQWSFATGKNGRSGVSGRTSGSPPDPSAGALSLAFVSDPRLLALELQAIEATGGGEVISEPRIVTSNRRPATIRQGEQLPFVTVDQNGQSRTEFKDAVLELKVTPILREDGRIEMTLDIRQDQVSQLSTAQGPAIDTRELNTRVTVDPGQTLVLGGIYESKEEEITTGVPGLSAIPLLGRAFRSTEHRSFKSELLIFITPRVL